MFFLLSSIYYSGVGFMVGGFLVFGFFCDTCCYFEKTNFEGAFIHSHRLRVSYKRKCPFSHPAK